jgi:glutamyl-tRNA synthetase
MKTMPEAELGQRLVPFLRRAGLDPTGGPDAGAVGNAVAGIAPKRCRDGRCRLVFLFDTHGRRGQVDRGSSHRSIARRWPSCMTSLRRFHGHANRWQRRSRAAASRHAIKPAQVMMPLRLLVAGTPSTPAIDAVLALLGRDTTRSRMAAGLGLA